jgi:hypothetical protein
MSFSAYATATSVAQGDDLHFRVSDDAGSGSLAAVSVFDVPSGNLIHNDSTPAGDWILSIPNHWASSLYKAVFDPGAGEAYFVVRAANPGAAARLLVSIPFATWHAYTDAGAPGLSLYWNEQPDRASRISLDRPAGPTGWEDGFLNWIATSGYAVDYCSNLDLHDGLELLSAYQLLVCLGHDEYWSKEMRDTVESFADRGGNVAFFTGNTCWWQFRLEDDGRTIVCYRDATQDPLTGVDDSRVTVEWSSAPVNRPENQLTGVSFRRGAGCWANTAVMPMASYTCRFGRHWTFEGTGLRDGDSFATGAIGYETDAADYDEVDGVPRITGRDGTPPTFVILATADLRSWRAYGQGGMATMGVFRKGGGTVFNTGTTGWCNKLPDTIVDRITRNVLDRLSQRFPADEWELIGHANAVTAMVACENRLWAADSDSNLWCREPINQNLNWSRVGHANEVVAMASPREAIGGHPIGLYAVTADGGVWHREPILADITWNQVGEAPAITALAACYEGLFAATSSNELLYIRFSDLGGPPSSWSLVGHANNLVAMTNLNGRLYAVDRDNRLWIRPPVLADVSWTDVGHANAVNALAGHAGKLFVSTKENLLWARDAVSL